MTGVDWGRDGDVVSCSMDHTVRAWDLDTQQCTINLGEDLALYLSLFLSLARSLAFSLCLGLGRHRLLGLYTLAFSTKRSARACSLSRHYWF